MRSAVPDNHKWSLNFPYWAFLVGLCLSLLITPEAARAQSASQTFSKTCPEDVRALPASRLWPEYCALSERPAAFDGGSGPLAPLSGVWHVELRGLDASDLKVDPALTLILLRTSGRSIRNDKVQMATPVWTYGMIETAPGKPPRFKHFDGTKQAELIDRGLQVNAGSLGAGGETLTIQLKPDANAGVSASWVMKDRSGKADLTKRPPRIKTAFFYATSSKTDHVDTVPFGTRPGNIVKTAPLTCGFGNMRGNCPTFWIDLIGENLIGRHPFWLDPASRLEIETKWICKDETTVSDWHTCLHFGGNVGVRIKGYIHNNARSGEHTLWVYGQPVRFKFTVEVEDPGPVTIKTSPLVFIGQSPAQSISTKPLTFVGLSRSMDIETKPLVFVGQSPSHEITTEPLTFVGMSPSAAINTAPLMFVGLSRSHEIKTDALTFVGLSPAQRINSLPLVFHGQSPATKITTKPLTFQGQSPALRITTKPLAFVGAGKAQP